MYRTPGQLGVSQRALRAPHADRERPLARGLALAAPAFAGHVAATGLSCAMVKVEDIPPSRANAP